MGFISAKAALTADWKIHMPFDQWASQVVETPSRVYFLNRTFELNNSLSERSMPSYSLFYYDKAGDEIISVNERTNASGNAVACIGYNAAKKYLLVVYTDCNIDFIYEDGRVYNLQALKASSTQGKKMANSISFDNANNRAYVATSFGYVALNDDKHEIAESRVYGENVQSIARCGSNIVLCIDNQIHFAPASSQRFNLSDYHLLEGAPAIGIVIPLESDRFLGYKNALGTYIDVFTPSGDTYTWERFTEDHHIFGYQQTPSGISISGNYRQILVTPSGELSTLARNAETEGVAAGSIDYTSLWALSDRKGLRQYKRSGDSWTLVRDFMRPNAPAAYIVTGIQYHPSYGIIAGSNGVDLAYNEFNQLTPDNLSALKGGFWKEYGPAYKSNVSIPFDYNFYGVAVDPQNPKYIYRANTLSGLMRLNMENPDDIMIFANPSSRNASVPGFVRIADDLDAWNILCHVTAPGFSPDGTLWALYNNTNSGRAEFWYWSAADRAATTSAANYRGIKKLVMPDKFESGNSDVMTVLSQNRNMVVAVGNGNYGQVLIYDHRGTPDSPADDRYALVQSPYDQDGNLVNFLAINNVVEDPETGLLWILSQRGVFTVNPATAFDNPSLVNRIKVSRNDGTGLADYLLNEINVNHMSIDGEGRKWFATSSGIVCTSRDGRQILAEFTTDNSYLPDDNVYATCYNPENNSLLVATGGGLVEMFPSGSGNSSSDSESGMRAYPNPVEPDYYGWVRIDNIADGSLVKITDAKGGLVKELGPAQGGSVEWDISGLNNTRVTTGVYYIMVSPGSAGGKSEISKILILN